MVAIDAAVGLLVAMMSTLRHLLRKGHVTTYSTNLPNTLSIRYPIIVPRSWGVLYIIVHNLNITDFVLNYYS